MVVTGLLVIVLLQAAIGGLLWIVLGSLWEIHSDTAQIATRQGATVTEVLDLSAQLEHIGHTVRALDGKHDAHGARLTGLEARHDAHAVRLEDVHASVRSARSGRLK